METIVVVQGRDISGLNQVGSNSKKRKRKKKRGKKKEWVCIIFILEAGVKE